MHASTGQVLEKLKSYPCDSYALHFDSGVMVVDYVFVIGGMDNPRFWVPHVKDLRGEEGGDRFSKMAKLYSPEGLPIGNQLYHGGNELLGSNWEDTVDGLTASGLASFYCWAESDSEKPRRVGQMHLWSHCSSYCCLEIYALFFGSSPHLGTSHLP